MSASIELKKLEMTFPGGIQALKPVNLHIEAGERLAIVGPSGSGKSTLLRLIAGLETQTGGEVWIDGRRVDDRPSWAREIGMVFQTPALFPHLNVFDNLAFGLRARRTSSEETGRRVREVADRLGLSEVVHRRPHALSGGQRQRVALGRAFVRRPAVLLLDEPFSALDPPLRADLRAVLSEMHEMYGCTLLHVTHDQAEALSVGDRLALFQNGRLEAVGEPQALYDGPPTRFVGEFLGSPPMNFLQVEVRKLGESVRIRGLGRLGEERDWPDLGAPREGPMVLGFRPESARIGEATEGAFTFDAKLERIERLGHESIGVLMIERERVHIRLPSRLHVCAGEMARVWIPPDALRWFDPDSGESLGRLGHPGHGD